MTRPDTAILRILILGGLLLGGLAPASADDEGPDEARIREEVTRAARDLLEATRKRDVKAILALVSERGLRCDDDYTSRSDLSAALKRPGTYYHALFFDTARLREYVDAEPPYVSLLEVVEKGGELKFAFVFWDDFRGSLFEPCVYVKPTAFGYEPTLCFHKEKGRWRLWKSPQPTCS